MDLDKGGFYSGDQVVTSPTITLRKGDKFTASLRWTRTDIDLPQGDFITNLSSVRLNYNFSRFVYVNSLIQYNDRIDQWSTNVRFSWLNTAGTGLFIVYNDTEGLERIGPINRAFIIKYTRQFDVLR